MTPVRFGTAAELATDYNTNITTPLNSYGVGLTAIAGANVGELVTAINVQRVQYNDNP